MCCLFGILDYKHALSPDIRVKYLQWLAVECESRGRDATGFAYHDGRRLCIHKRPYPAQKMRFRLPTAAKIIMGHTRMTTQGDEQFNKNNHPFFGKAGATRFALAHNGVLYNDQSLRKQYALPPTDIETDSYAAVQLLEAMGELGFGSIAEMAKAVRGSFTFTIMDDKSGVYFVKGSNPLALYHFDRLGLYVYASTEEILRRALAKMALPGEYEEVPMEMGDILYIAADGSRAYGAFDCGHLSMDWYSSLWGKSAGASALREADFEAAYLDDLKSVSPFFGYSEKDVDAMAADGMTAEEIEALFCGEGRW